LTNDMPGAVPRPLEQSTEVSWALPPGGKYDKATFRHGKKQEHTQCGQLTGSKWIRLGEKTTKPRQSGQKGGVGMTRPESPMTLKEEFQNHTVVFQHWKVVFRRQLKWGKKNGRQRGARSRHPERREKTGKLLKSL